MSAQKKEWLARKALEKKRLEEERQKQVEAEAAQTVPDITAKIGEVASGDQLARMQALEKIPAANAT